MESTTPNLFIMSSGFPGRPIAETLRDLISQDKSIEVDVWSQEEIFGPNEAFFDGLTRSMLIYDFGLSILTPDDLVQKKEDQVIAPRDNVMFEIGLFMGGRGRSNAQLLPVHFTDEKPELPSDLKGYKYEPLKMPFAKAELAHLSRGALKQTAAIVDMANRIKDRLVTRYGEPAPSILPSTGLAMGYFENFIKPVLESLSGCPRIEMKVDGRPKEEKGDVFGVKLEKFKIIVLVPLDLDKATKEEWNRESSRRKLKVGTVDVPDESPLPRPYPFNLSYDPSSEAVRIYDMPTTLFTTRTVVNRLLSVGGFSQKVHRDQAVEREIHNFVNTLKYLLDLDEYRKFKPLVKIEEL